MAEMLIPPRHMKRIMSNQGSVAGFGRDLSGSVGLSLLPACDTCEQIMPAVAMYVAASRAKH